MIRPHHIPLRATLTPLTSTPSSSPPLPSLSSPSQDHISPPTQPGKSAAVPIFMDETPSLRSWAPRASKRSHTQMSTEHQQARRDHLDQWIRDTDRAATPPLPHPHFGFDTQTSSSSTTRLQTDARRSYDLRRPSNPAHPPRQTSRTPAENMSQRDHVEVIDLTEPREAEANGTLGRQHEIEDDVVSDGEWERIFMAIQDEDEEEEEQTRIERPPTPPARRGPRFGRDIIDLSEDTTPPHQEPADPNRSPEVEFVRARQRTPPPPAPDPPQVVDITDIPDQGDDEDDIQFIREAPRPPREGLADYLEPEMRRPFTNFPFLWGGMAGGMARAQTYFGAQLGRTRANMDFVQRHVTNPTLQRILAPGIRTLPPPRMHMPINLNYATPAFNIGISPATSERGESPMPVPDELPEGVHSAPSKDLELVCPHCGDLLGEGDTEDKRQVWAVKACGHAYCGECTVHRHKTKRKGPDTTNGRNPQPFNVCCVDDCDSKLTPKGSMFQLFF